MGIDLAAFEFLLKAHREFGDFGSTLVLGRQRLLVRNDADKARLAAVLQRYRPDMAMDDVLDDYVDRFIGALGGNPYQVMDNSAYEGAEVIHDLNDPLPEALHGRFDTVIDIGTLEHVFNIGTAMKSMAQAVRIGGQFLCLNIANNHLGHGFWQFSPEVFFRTFAPVHGYEPRLAELHHGGGFHPLRDPEEAGRRLPIKTPGYTYVIFGARRTAEAAIFPDGWPVQADYVAAWTVFLARRAEREGDPGKAESILREALGKAPRNPVYMMTLAGLLKRADPGGAEAGTLLARARDLAPDHPGLAAEEPLSPAPAAAVPANERVAVAALEFVLKDPLIPEKTADALLRGRYEFKEREVARRLLKPGDRVIELGAGMGVVSLTMARLIGGEAVRSFEANPKIIVLARENARHNGLPVTFHNVIASPRQVAEATPHIDFFVLNSFEASSTRRVSDAQTPVRIPTTPLEDEIARHRANVLVFDIEGFETEIIEKTDLSAVERVMFEIHPKILGAETCMALVDRLEAHGLMLRRDLAFGDVIAFERGATPGTMPGSALFKALLDMETAALGGDWARAGDIAASIEEDVVDNAYVQFRISQIEAALGRDGLERALRAEALGSEDFLLFNHLALLHLGRGDLQRAEMATDRLEALFPTSLAIEGLRAQIGRLP